MKSISVPFLPEARIDKAADELLQRYSKWKTGEFRQPINVEHLVESFLELDFGFEDLRVRLGVRDVLGATWFDDRRIRIDSSLESGHDGRMSFTVGHECGHWILHKPLHDERTMTPELFPVDESSTPTAAVVCRIGQAKERAEWQADRFASGLLMPPMMMAETLQRLKGESIVRLPGLDRTQADGTIHPGLRALAAEFIADGKFSNVSNEAMRIKILALGFVEDSASAQGRLF